MRIVGGRTVARTGNGFLSTTKWVDPSGDRPNGTIDDQDSATAGRATEILEQYCDYDDHSESDRIN